MIDLVAELRRWAAGPLNRFSDERMTTGFREGLLAAADGVEADPLYKAARQLLLELRKDHEETEPGTLNPTGVPKKSHVGTCSACALLATLPKGPNPSPPITGEGRTT